MPDYLAKVSPGRFDFVVDDLRRTFGDEFPEWVVSSCGLHFFVASGTDYVRSGTDIPSPAEMLNRLQGDCEDQSVLLASLYEAAGLEPRFVEVSDSNGNKPHVLTEVYCPVPDADTTSSVVRKFYRRELDRDPGAISWEDADGPGCWFVADPEFSRYVGDVENLQAEDYVRSTSDGGWEWTYRRQVHQY